jgi:hypothetical protein
MRCLFEKTKSRTHMSIAALKTKVTPFLDWADVPGRLEKTIIPALLPIFLTMSHIVLAADSVPKFDVERTCRPASASLPGRDSSTCQRDEEDARGKLLNDWIVYSVEQRGHCTRLAGIDRAPSYVELLTCLEMAKQADELPEESKTWTDGRR